MSAKKRTRASNGRVTPKKPAATAEERAVHAAELPTGIVRPVLPPRRTAPPPPPPPPPLHRSGARGK